MLFEEERDGVRQRVVRAADGIAWDGGLFPGEELRELNLEEIFIAMVRDKTWLGR